MNTLDQFCKEFYAAQFFEVGSRPDIEKLKSFCTPNAIVIDYTEAAPMVMNVNDYFDMFNGWVESGEIPGFYEIEANAKTEVFGNIAHRWSTYAFKISKKDPEFTYGINSIQLVKIDEEWKIQSLMYQMQTEEEPIPAGYIPHGVKK